MIHEIGEFKVTSEKLRISDPCHPSDTWCAGTLKYVLNGTWKACYKTFGYMPKFITELICHHKDFPLSQLDFSHRASFEVGVDSGIAGIFDENYFESDNEIWYEDVTEPLMSDVAAYVGDGFVLSRAGYGDGGYDCFYVKTKDGTVIGAKIIFIEEEEDEC